jgi:hypothetical protein
LGAAQIDQENQELRGNRLRAVMGTSVAQIDATYGHLLPDSEEYLRGLLDAFDGVYGLSADEAGPLTQRNPFLAEECG